MNTNWSKSFRQSMPTIRCLVGSVDSHFESGMYCRFHICRNNNVDGKLLLIRKKRVGGNVTFDLIKTQHSGA